MARTKRKINPLVREESSAPAGKRYKTAAYVRLSAEDGGKPGADTIDGQKALLTSFIESKPDMELVAVFCDNGRTGTDFERPQFEKMMEEVRKGRVNCIAVKACRVLVVTTRKPVTIWSVFSRFSASVLSRSTTILIL